MLKKFIIFAAKIYSYEQGFSKNNYSGKPKVDFRREVLSA